MNTLSARTTQTITMPTMEGMPPSRGVSAGGPGMPDPPRFRPQIVRSVRARPLLALVTGLLVAALVILFALRQPRVYEAESRVYVEPMVARNLNDQGAPGFDQFRYGSYVEQQLQTVTRPDTLAAALETPQGRSWRHAGESEQTAIARLQKALTVERVETSYEIRIALKATDPHMAADVVNAVTNAYLRGGRRDELAESGGRLQLLSEERDRLRKELDTAHQEQARLGATLGMANPATETLNPFDQQLANLRTELATAQQAHDVAAAQLASVSGQGADQQSGLAAAADESLSSEAGLASLKSSMYQRRALLVSQMAGLTPSNPQYKQDQNEIADLDRTLDTMTTQLRGRTEQRIQDKLKTDLERTAEVEGRLNGQIAQLTSRATSAGPKLQRASELASDIQRLNQSYTITDEALRSLALETNGPGMAHMAHAAMVPAMPEPNKSRILLLAALPLGLFAGISAAVLARLRDRRMYIARDLEEALGFAPIAILPARAEVSARVLDEYLLRLAAGIESAYRTGSARVFMVTAVNARSETQWLLEGLAEKLRALRLDVGIVRAVELLGMSDETAEYVAANPEGLERQGATEQGEGIASVKLDRLRVRHHVVLVDAPPLLLSAGSEYVARCADVTILVAESGRTRADELAGATALLSRLRVRGVGAVLAEIRLEHADAGLKQAIRGLDGRTNEGLPPRRTNRRREDVAELPSGLATEPEMVDAKAAPVEAAEAVPVETLEALPDEDSVTSLEDGEAIAPHVEDATLEEVDPVAPVQEAEVEQTQREHEAVPDSNGAGVDQGSDLLRGDEARVERKTTRAHDGPHSEGASTLSERPASGVTSVLVAEAEDSEAGGVPHGTHSAKAAFDEDLAPVGRLVEEDDRVVEVPLHTRSKIRLAFKEQEVSPRTTWFSKLFRGDPPASFRIVPENERAVVSELESIAVERHASSVLVGDDRAEAEPVDRERTLPGADPEFDHLLSRISVRTRESYRTTPDAEPEKLFPVPRPLVPEPAPISHGMQREDVSGEERTRRAPGHPASVEHPAAKSDAAAARMALRLVPDLVRSGVEPETTAEPDAVPELPEIGRLPIRRAGLAAVLQEPRVLELSARRLAAAEPISADAEQIDAVPQAGLVEEKRKRSAGSVEQENEASKMAGRPSGLSRRWGLLSQFEEPSVTDPEPAARRPAYRPSGGGVRQGEED